MRTLPDRLARPARGLLLAALATLLLACGGGFDIAGGVGSGGSGMAEGRVSGFGSILVDGVEYDDTGAAVHAAGPDGHSASATARVGQRVRLTLDARGQASAIEVLPQLLGPVTAAEAGGWLQVAGQWVKVTDATVRGGLVAAAPAAAGDELEVHGGWVADAQKGHVLEASRIEPRAGAAHAPLLVSGIVQAVRTDRGRTIVVLNREGGSEVRSAQAPADLAAGQLVSVWVARASLAMPAFEASSVRSGEPPAAEGQTLVLGGPVRMVGNGRIAVQGVTATLPPGVSADAVGAGTFVQLTLRRARAGWEVAGLKARGRPEDLGGRVLLKGTARGIDWTARPLVLAVRDTPVDIPPDVLAASNCSGMTAEAVQVEVTALPGRQPLGALALRCSAATPGGARGANGVDQLTVPGSSPRTQ